MKAAKNLEAQGISCEVIDIRSIRPLDQDAIFNSVAKTGRCLVAHEGHIFAGVGAEIATRVQEACFEYLSAPVMRVANRDVPQPYATVLEKAVMPTPERVVEAALRVAQY